MSGSTAGLTSDQLELPGPADRLAALRGAQLSASPESCRSTSPSQRRSRANGSLSRLSLTYADGAGPAAGYLFAAVGLAVVLVYLAGNIAVIRAFGDEFRIGRHLLIPAVAVVIFLFSLWGIVHPPAYTLVNLLPFIALGWLGLEIVVAGVLRARGPATFQTLGTVSVPSDR